VLGGWSKGESTRDARYEAPETFEASLALIAAASGEARVLAGGTDP
jgi:CO/xanthine dehydrogenase FAD-binding subunit